MARRLIHQVRGSDLRLLSKGFFMNSSFARIVFVSVLLALAAGCSSSDDTDNDGHSGGAASAQHGQTVSGHVILSGDLSGLTFPISGTVSVIDVTYADGPSTTIASQTISVTSADPTAFSIPVSGIDPKASYAVQVHIDSDGSGTNSEGDFYNEESFPVLNDSPDTVEVTAKRS